MGTIGNLKNIKGEMNFEWEIKDFLQLGNKLNEEYRSPEFSFSGDSWVILIYPYGEDKQENFGYIGLYLESTSVLKPVTVDVLLGIKTLKDKNDLTRSYARIFMEKNDTWGWGKIISRSDFIKKKSDLLPSNSLTVICNLKNSETNIVTEKTFLDASAQTDEGIGVWKLQQHLRDISFNGDISDIVLKVKDQEFKSHRCILAARSPVFSAMMKTEMKENVTGVVDIEDVNPKVFSHFLSYLYTGSTEDITPENVTKLYTAADKYQVEALKENCLDYMLVNISLENFCNIFIISVQHNEEKLKETCIQYFVEHSLDIVKTCTWQSFLCENPIISNELFIKYIELNRNL